MISSRESYGENRASTFFRFELNHALVSVNYLLGDHKSNAGAGGSLGTEKAGEELLSNFCCHAAAIVCDLILNSPALRLGSLEKHFFWCV